MPAGRAAILAAVALIAAGIPGCAGKESAVGLSAADLQRDLSEKLAAEGTPAKSVACAKDLPAAVGRTTRCVVEFSPSDSIDAILTTTGVDGGKVSYEITRPELTREQLAKRVAAMAVAQSATCESGLDGQVGDWALCEVTKSGATVRQAVEVRRVKGLTLDLAVTQVLPKQQLEDELMTRLTTVLGRRPDKAECAGDLSGVIGTSMDCVVTLNDKPQPYVVTVTGLSGGVINFAYQLKG